MWRSSSVPITQKDLSSSRSAGWSNERSHGSDDAGVSPKIGRISTERRSHFCASLQSSSCSENYAIPHDLSGQTLSDYQGLSGRTGSVFDFRQQVLIFRVYQEAYGRVLREEFPDQFKPFEGERCRHYR